jgi:hypothetical protein
MRYRRRVTREDLRLMRLLRVNYSDSGMVRRQGGNRGLNHRRNRRKWFRRVPLNLLLGSEERAKQMEEGRVGLPIGLLAKVPDDLSSVTRAMIAAKAGHMNVIELVPVPRRKSSGWKFSGVVIFVVGGVLLILFGIVAAVVAPLWDLPAKMLADEAGPDELAELRDQSLNLPH